MMDSTISSSPMVGVVNVYMCEDVDSMVTSWCVIQRHNIP